MPTTHAYARLISAALILVLLAACGTNPAAAPTSAPAPATPVSDIAVAPVPTIPVRPATPTVKPTAAPTAAPTAVPAPPKPAAPPAAGQKVCDVTPVPGPTTGDKQEIVIGTGSPGGVFFPLGSGLARLFTVKVPNTEATAKVTAGSVENMKLIQAHQIALGLSTVDSAWDAVRGQGAYKDTGVVPACALAVLYQSFLHVVAREDSGIAAVADMRGKRISVGASGSSTEVAADRVLEAAGLDPRANVLRENLGVADSVTAMREGKIDAFFWIGGLPTASITDLLSSGDVKVRFIPTADFVAPMVTKYGPVYTNVRMLKETYPGLTADVPGIGIGNILFAGANMPEQQAYDLIKALFDNLSNVQQFHPEAKSIWLESAPVGSSIPFHPGAVKFYKEKGVWKE